MVTCAQHWRRIEDDEEQEYNDDKIDTVNESDKNAAADDDKNDTYNDNDAGDDNNVTSRVIDSGVNFVKKYAINDDAVGCGDDDDDDDNNGL